MAKNLIARPLRKKPGADYLPDFDPLLWGEIQPVGFGYTERLVPLRHISHTAIRTINRWGMGIGCNLRAQRFIPDFAAPNSSKPDKYPLNTRESVNHRAWLAP
jgi:hypothetical protein